MSQTAAPETAPPRLAIIAVALVVVTGGALRFITRSDLWLDEALSVNIANLPLGEMPEALRHDGAPPLYYLLLHAWIRVFGSGDLAVRSLSGVVSVAALPFAWLAGRQIGGTRVATASLLLVASSPFAIRYGTEARMYALVTLFAAIGYVSLRAALVAPRPLPLAGLVLASGLAMLTHYWSFYLLAVVAVTLVVAARRSGDRKPLAAMGALAAGGVLFLPWLPSFVYQLGHTGTPWGTPAGPVDVAITTITDFGGGRPPEARSLAALLAALIGVALTGRSIDKFRIELDVRTRPGIRVEAVAAATTLVVGVVVGLVGSSAFASRYTAVILPVTLLVVAWGIAVFADPRVRVAILGTAVVLGLAGGVRNVMTQRTQAGEIAARINARATPGDAVVFCPDQLGPAVERLLRQPFELVRFPDAGDPQFVDWVDYRDRNRGADPSAFASELAQRFPDRDVWLVWMPGYRTFGEKCERLSVAIGNGRPATRLVLLHDRKKFERQNLTHAPAP